MPAIRDLIAERERLCRQARDMISLADSEKRSVTGDEQEKLDILWAEIDRLGEQRRLLEQQTKREDELIQDEHRTRLAEERVKKSKVLSENKEERAVQEKRAFTNWIRFGIAGLGAEDRAIMQENYAQLPAEARALSVGTDSAGGYTVPTGFQAELDRAMLEFGGMREAARVVRTAAGNDLEWPTVDDTSNTGAILAENNQVTEQDVTFAQVTLQSFMYTSKLVRVSFQLLQDSAIDIGAELASMLGERIARITNTHFTTGDGSSKPRGVVTAATDSTKDLTAAAPTYNQIVDVLHTVDPSYRRNARWMMDDTTFSLIRKVVTYDGSTAVPEFVWQQGLAPGAPDTILGYPYTINQDVGSLGDGAGTECLLFGDFSKYIIRDAGPATLLRLQERYADYLQVGFIAFSRHDGDLVSGGTPIKYGEEAT